MNSILLVGINPVVNHDMKPDLVIDGSQIHTLSSLGIDDLEGAGQFFAGCQGIMAVTDQHIEDHILQLTQRNPRAVIHVDAQGDGAFHISRMTKAPVAS